MPHKADKIFSAFGHPAITKTNNETRARLGYELANECNSLYAAQLAIDYADAILRKKPSFREELIARWKVSATKSWLPPANFRPVAPEVKIFKKGSECLPRSHRYIGLQLRRAAGLTNATTRPHQLLRDVVIAHGLGTFDDPRPINFEERKQLLVTSPIKLYETFLASKRAAELYDVLHSFNAGITSRDTVMAWALQRRSIGVTTSLPVHSYTAIARRVVAPKVTTEPVTRGIPDTELSGFAASQLRHVTKGGTAKRLKIALESFDQADISVIRQAVSRRASPRPRPLAQPETEAQSKLPNVFVMWCNHCQSWRVNTGSETAIVIDLDRPKQGLCGSCNHDLLPVLLNGSAIGSLRLCSCCGKMLFTSDSFVYRGLLTTCKVCAQSMDSQSQSCVKCGAMTNKFIMCAGTDTCVALYLCTTHHPGATAFDPLTNVEQAIKHL